LVPLRVVNRREFGGKAAGANETQRPKYGPMGWSAWGRTSGDFHLFGLRRSDERQESDGTSSQTENELPHPHDFTACGLLKTNPRFSNPS